MRNDHPGSNADLTVNEILDAYLTEHVEHKVVDKFRQNYGANHVKNHLGRLPIADIDIPKCRKYVKERAQEEAQNSTIRRELTILRAAANHALRWRKITPDQMPQFELPEEGEPDTVMWFTKEQMVAMFRECSSGKLACFIRICYFTGARRRSVERLWKSQIDLMGQRIHLWRPGEKITKKRRPTVPLYPEIRPSVDWLMQNSGTQYLFGAHHDFYKPFAKLTKRLGFEGHPHMLRHSRATHMLQEGESVFKVAKLLGDSVATVERVYGHSSVEFLATNSTVSDEMRV